MTPRSGLALALVLTAFGAAYVIFPLLIIPLIDAL